jgi:hypothetical protein
VAMNSEQERALVSAEFPRQLRDRLARAAEEHDRSFSAELREAARAYLANQVPGSASSRPEPAQRDETSHLGRQSSSSLLAGSKEVA